ncbi:hypothetical protein HMPREF9996_02015 [Aggregatibacter actinomycetemcomitans Y4]|nr:hypothetical protein HMPREF9996_02015 [Aggregatibacter actinomycetemcomitans Y4]
MVIVVGIIIKVRLFFMVFLCEKRMCLEIPKFTFIVNMFLNKINELNVIGID